MPPSAASSYRVGPVALWLCGLVLAAASGLARAQASATTLVPLPARMTRVTAVEGITEYALPNGLHVLTLPDASKPVTTVNLTIKVGSRMENYGETGMAHLLEHLMFKGTPDVPRPKKAMSDLGLAWNSTTSDDRTGYFASMAENPANLDFYLHWLAEALTQSFIARKDLDSEMTVVRNEMESGENDPERILFENVIAATLSLAQLRQVDDRRARRRREREHRAPAGLLPPLLPARQRGAHRRRQIRRDESACHHRLDVRQDRPAGPRDRADLHARSDTGRRKDRDAAPGRRHPDAARPVPRAGRPGARFRADRAGHDHARRRRIPPAQRRAGGEEPRRFDLRQRAGAGRAGLCVLRRDPEIGSVDRRGARRDAGDDRGHRPHALYRGRARPGEEHLAARLHPEPQRSAAGRPGPLGIHRRRRLAARLRPARPRQGGDAGRRQPGREPVLRDQQPHPRHLHSEPGAGARARAREGRRRRPHAELQGRRGGGGRRELRRLAGERRSSHHDRDLARRRRRARRLAAEEHARR